MALTVNTEPTRVRTGPLWRQYDAETSILIDGLDNEEYQIALERARRRIFARDREAGAGDIVVLDGEETEHVTQCKLLGRFVIRGWRGATDGSGNPIEYTPEAAAATLRGDVNFFLWIIKQATEVSAEQHREVAETMGKCSSGIDGSGNGAVGPTNAS